VAFTLSAEAPLLTTPTIASIASASSVTARLLYAPAGVMAGPDLITAMLTVEAFNRASLGEPPEGIPLQPSRALAMWPPLRQQQQPGLDQLPRPFQKIFI